MSGAPPFAANNSALICAYHLADHQVSTPGPSVCQTLFFRGGETGSPCSAKGVWHERTPSLMCALDHLSVFEDILMQNKKVQFNDSKIGPWHWNILTVPEAETSALCNLHGDLSDSR